MNTDSGEVKLHFLDYWRVLRVRLPLIILVFLLVVITASVISYLMPRMYQSSVTMQLKQSDREVGPIFGQGGLQGFDPRFISTQFAIIQNKEMLYPVIDALGLQQRWAMTSRELTFRRLRKMLTPKEIRNTELIQIAVSSTDPVEAAEIANAIGDEYQRRRVSEQSERATAALTQLREEIDKQSKQVDELKATATKIRLENNIPDLSPDSVQDTAQPVNSVLAQVEQQVSTKRLDVAAQRATYKQVSEMPDEELMLSLDTLLISDQIIKQVLPQYKEASATEAQMLQSGLGPNHPNVRALRARRNELEDQLKKQTKALKNTLKANLEIEEERLKNLEQSLHEARGAQQDERTKSGPYFEAKSAYIQAKNVLDAARMKLSTQTMEFTMPTQVARIWEKAERAPGPYSPDVPLIVGLSAAVGLVLGVGLAFFIEYLDTSVKTMEDVETFLQVPVLAVIPKNISLLINEPPDNPDAEAYRIMRTNIEFNRKNPEASTITIVSGGTGEGKSTTMANIAYTFAQGGYSTLIVDADLRRPSQYRIFGVSNDTGLTDYLTTDVELEEVVLQTKIDNLFLLPSGRIPADAVGILNSQRMVEFIEEVKSRFDIIFFDSPPILGVSDASVLSSAIDLTIIVVQHRRFPRAMLQRVKQAVINVGGNILGVVLNNVDVRHDQHYEYYTSYYNYYYQKPSREQKKAPKKAVVVATEKESEKSEETY